MKKLLVLIPDRLSELIAKGEITTRYYNPGDLFDEVHIIMTNDDKPDIDKLSITCGSAKLFAHNYPISDSLFRYTLGYRPYLLKIWAKRIIKLALEIKPDLVRCYGVHLNTILAKLIKEKLNIPYIVSIHTNPDTNYRGCVKGLKNKIISNLTVSVEKAGLRGANLVLPVYESIKPYLQRLGILNYEIKYNVINKSHIREKIDYSYRKPFRVLCIGRQYDHKNPINIIKSVLNTKGTALDIIGNGVIHKSLVDYVSSKNVGDKIKFYKTITNSELCEKISSYDLVMLNSECHEFSKVLLESFLTGMPVIINYRTAKEQVPELNSRNCLRVQNSVEGYETGLQLMMSNKRLRESIGRGALKFAKNTFDPIKAEMEYVNVYKRFLRAQ